MRELDPLSSALLSHQPHIDDTALQKNKNAFFHRLDPVDRGGRTTTAASSRLPFPLQDATLLFLFARHVAVLSLGIELWLVGRFELAFLDDLWIDQDAVDVASVCVLYR